MKNASGRPIIVILTDLIKINYDRIAAYEKAAHESRNSPPDLRDLFYRISVESRAYVNELHAKLILLGGAPVGGATVGGNIYRSWAGVKAEPAGNDTVSLLNGFETTEGAIQKSYEMVLESKPALPLPIQSLVERQRGALQSAYEIILRYRERYKAKR